MSLKNSLIAKVTRLDLTSVLRIEAAALEHIRTNAEVPAEFAAGREAFGYALQSIALRRPELFWGAWLAIVAIPGLLLLRVVS
ncbi:hypothetical protein ACI2UK_13630 [Ralstonia nicotianae]|uniref:hypothetical protein n=1 Tax=Ralstonia pseudosolanacearum TaxID=1310165 RepID=UPI002006973D|nr:hypothetical protein [Ralstonia pseudosolanacearum]MCK4118415.1 hypothetical protein [Ralstonia pseudosolanacearum]